jgi:hypothetical protein
MKFEAKNACGIYIHGGAIGQSVNRLLGVWWASGGGGIIGECGAEGMSVRVGNIHFPNMDKWWMVECGGSGEFLNPCDEITPGLPDCE